MPVPARAGLLRPAGAWLALAVSCATLLFGHAAALAAETPSEDQVKAAFLLNFPKYVDWPAGAFADSNSPIVFTVIGDKSVEAELRRMAEGKSFNGRPLEVRSASPEDGPAADSQIVFVGVAEERRAPEIMARLGERSVLSVGDGEDFLERDGGIIRLARRDRKIRLEVNLEAARTAHLRISSRLLSVADVVKGKSR